jgi:hypothetical protein
MANLNESIEQLTESLQELAARPYCHIEHGETAAESMAVDELMVSKEVELFVTDTRAYADRTRNVSVGTY